MIIILLADIRNRPDWIGKNRNPCAKLVLQLDEPLQEKEKSYKAEAHIVAIADTASIKGSSGKLVLYFSKTAKIKILGYGSRILVNGSLVSISGPANPGGFDYRRYSAFHNIYHTMYLKEYEWVLLDQKATAGYKALLYKSRDQILAVIRKYMGVSGNETAIAEALIIGYKSSVDKDLLQAYSNTGLVHVIAISGMHLALVNEILIWIFSLFGITRFKILSGILNIACLWIFALLTGGSASVLRSAVMFSFVITGKLLNKQGSVYNSLASSAFLLLCFDPFMFWDAGFQLSYLAVLGLVMLQRPVAGMFEIDNKWLDKIWSLCAVTISAQVFALPACLYYFHQFPNYFLISNLLVVPLSTVILFVGIFLLVFYWVPFLGPFVGSLLNKLIQLMNISVEYLGNLPGATTSSIKLELLGVCFLYLTIIFICCWLFGYSRKFLVSAFAALCVVSFFRVYDILYTAKQQKVIIYSIKGHTAIDIIRGTKIASWKDSPIDSIYKSVLDPSRIMLRADEGIVKLDVDSAKILQFAGSRIFVVDSISIPVDIGRKRPDILLVRDNPWIKMSNMAFLQPKLIVFDGSNPLWKIDQWQKECEALNLSCYSIPRQGAFILNLN